MEALILAGVVAIVLVAQVFSEHRRSQGISLMMSRFVELNQQAMESSERLHGTIREMQTVHHENMFAISRETNVANSLRENGITPYLSDPGSRLNADIQETMDNLGVDQAHAIKYLRQQLDVE